MSRLPLVLLVCSLVVACKKKEPAGAATGTATGTEAATGAAAAPGPDAAPPPTPAIDAAAPPETADEAPRKPTDDEIDLCGRLYASTLACGIRHDYEFGWVKADVKKLTRDESRKACSPPATTDEDGMSQFPVPILDKDKVMKVTVAALDGCEQVKKALDEVAPGPGPAGYDPSK